MSAERPPEAAGSTLRENGLIPYDLLSADTKRQINTLTNLAPIIQDSSFVAGSLQQCIDAFKQKLEEEMLVLQQEHDEGKTMSFDEVMEQLELLGPEKASKSDLDLPLINQELTDGPFE